MIYKRSGADVNKIIVYDDMTMKPISEISFSALPDVVKRLLNDNEELLNSVRSLKYLRGNKFMISFLPGLSIPMSYFVGYTVERNFNNGLINIIIDLKQSKQEVKTIEEETRKVTEPTKDVKSDEEQEVKEESKDTISDEKKDDKKEESKPKRRRGRPPKNKK